MDDRYIYGELNNKLNRAKPVSLVIEIGPNEWNEDNQVYIPVEGINSGSLVVCFYPTLATINDTELNMKVYSRMGIFCTALSNGLITLTRKNALYEKVTVGVWAWLS